MPTYFGRFWQCDGRGLRCAGRGCFVILLLATPGCRHADRPHNNSAFVRVINVAPSREPVTISIGSEQVIDQLGYADGTSYRPLDPGTYRIRAARADSSGVTLLPNAFPFSKGRSYTFVVTSIDGSGACKVMEFDQIRREVHNGLTVVQAYDTSTHYPRIDLAFNNIVGATCVTGEPSSLVSLASHRDYVVKMIAPGSGTAFASPLILPADNGVRNSLIITDGDREHGPSVFGFEDSMTANAFVRDTLRASPQ